MGVSEDINWLRGDEDGVGKIFKLIEEKGALGLRELKEFYGSNDWWPVKAYSRALVDRGLVEETENGYRLTEYGRNMVGEGLRTMEYLNKV